MLSYEVQHKNTDTETKFILKLIVLHRDVAAVNVSRHAISYLVIHGEGKVVTACNYLSTTPQRHTRGMEVQLHTFLASALDGGEQLHTTTTSPLWKEPLVPTAQENG
jgi:hypothetical protein